MLPGQPGFNQYSDFAFRPDYFTEFKMKVALNDPTAYKKIRSKYRIRTYDILDVNQTL